MVRNNVSKYCLFGLNERIKWNKNKISLQYYKSKEIEFQKRLLEDDRFLSCFLCYWRTEALFGIRYAILENRFDGVKQECLSLELAVENDRLVELGKFLRGSLLFHLSMKEYHSWRLKRKLDSKTDKRGVVESKCTNNAWLEYLGLSHGSSRSLRGQKAVLWAKKICVVCLKRKCW